MLGARCVAGALGVHAYAVGSSLNALRGDGAAERGGRLLGTSSARPAASEQPGGLVRRANRLGPMSGWLA